MATQRKRKKVSQEQVIHTYSSPQGHHRHQCYACDAVWEHSDENGGSVEAHTCPKCGAEPTEPGTVSFFDVMFGTVPVEFQNWNHYEGPLKPEVCESGACAEKEAA